jgi:release factor glutamine methyltransferase
VTPLAADEWALVELGSLLRTAGYHWTAVTPATHRRVNARPENAVADSLAGVFGWSRPFAPSLLAGPLLERLRSGGELVERPDGLLASAIRFSSLDGALYAHSAFFSDAADAVGFGPDTYRFVSALERRVEGARRAVEVCCGSGAGGLSLGERADRVTLTDLQPRALRLARINAVLGERTGVEVVQGDLFAGIEGDVDLIVANPPYLADPALGLTLARRIVAEGLARLSTSGQLILCTGAPGRAGLDLLRQELDTIIDEDVNFVDYEELDPDVFPDELERPGYGDIERIAAVCLDITKMG